MAVNSRQQLAVAFYISGHGFGHASRQVEIINAFSRVRPGTRVLVRTTAARWLLERTIERPFQLDDRPVDTGVVQIDALRLDERATVERAREFHRTFEQRADEEAAMLCASGVALVVSDAPALACEAAARAGLPSIAISNFTWDWIYGGYAAFPREAPDVIPAIQRAYRKAAAAWRLPMHGGFESFDTMLDLPFVARHANPDLARADVLRRLAIPDDRPVALVSFGGYGASDLPLDRLDTGDEWTTVLTGLPAERRRAGRIHVIADEDVYTKGLRYSDLVSAAEAVITKPGYGIISECIANDTAIVYTSRGHFVEYDVLVREMPRHVKCAYVSNEDMLAGRWRDALEAALGAAPPADRPRTDGAQVAGGMLSELL